jgi:endonuclease/exonuclease/phosphatase family metal-dependent hydrolase
MTEATPPKKKSRTNGLFLLINLCCVASLGLAFMAAYVPPSVYGYLSLFGLAFPAILLANLAFMLYWFVKRRKFVLVSFVPLVLGGGVFSDFFQINWADEEKVDGKTIKVLTYNVRLFGLYSGDQAKETRDSIFHFLQREDADILCFQEFFHSPKKGFFATRDTLVRFLPNTYYHERYTHALHGQKYFGVALFSKYPIVSKGYIPFENDPNNFCIYADLRIGSDTVRVYNAHLQSIRFKPEDYAFVEDNKNNEELKQGSKRIARRLKVAFQKREEQVEKVAASIEACPYKIILCGDFNDTPVSYTYSRFTRSLIDSFTESGNGIGNTYIGVFPSFRIDYILHSPSMKAVEYTTHMEEFSDHHAVSTQLVY